MAGFWLSQAIQMSRRYSCLALFSLNSRLLCLARVSRIFAMTCHVRFWLVSIFFLWPESGPCLAESFRTGYSSLELTRSLAKLCQIRRISWIRPNLPDSPDSPFSPNSPDSPKSPLRRYPYLKLNRSLAKFRQNRHSRRIRQNRRFVGTPISSSIALWRNFAKIAILIKFAGFVKIAASSVPLSRAQSLFGEISPKMPFSPNAPDSPKLPLRWYPYLKLNRSLVKFRQNRHSRRIRRIRQNRRLVGTPISSSIVLWRNFAKIAILAEFAGFDLIFGEISSKLPNLPLRAFLDISLYVCL